MKILCFVFRIASVLLLLTLSITSIAAEKKYTNNKEKLEMVEFIYAQLVTNSSKIQTWQGEYEFRVIEFYRDLQAVQLLNALGIKIEAEEMGDSEIYGESGGTVKFTLDCENDLLVSSRIENPEVRKMSCDIRKKELSRIKLFPININSFVVSDDHFTFESSLRNIEYKDVGGDIYFGAAGIRKPLDKRARFEITGAITDPRHIARVTSLPIIDYLQALCEESRNNYSDAEDFQERSLEVSSNDEIYTLTLPRKGSKPGRSAYSILVFDKKYGFNLITSSFILDASAIKEDRIKYKEIDGIFIPSSVEYTRYEVKKKNSVHMKVLLDLKESILNETIDTDVFTIKSLGMQDGQWFFDKIENMHYRYIGGELIPSERYNPNVGASNDTILVPNPFDDWNINQKYSDSKLREYTSKIMMIAGIGLVLAVVVLRLRRKTEAS